MILADISHQRLYITDNTGKSWKMVKPGFSPYRLLPSPNNETLVLGYNLREMKVTSLYIQTSSCCHVNLHKPGICKVLKIKTMQQMRPRALLRTADMSFLQVMNINMALVGISLFIRKTNFIFM